MREKPKLSESEIEESVRRGQEFVENGDLEQRMLWLMEIQRRGKEAEEALQAMKDEMERRGISNPEGLKERESSGDSYGNFMRLGEALSRLEGTGVKIEAKSREIKKPKGSDSNFGFTDQEVAELSTEARVDDALRERRRKKEEGDS